MAANGRKQATPRKPEALFQASTGVNAFRSPLPVFTFDRGDSLCPSPSTRWRRHVRSAERKASSRVTLAVIPIAVRGR